MNKMVRIPVGTGICRVAIAAFLAVSFMAATAYASLRRPAPSPALPSKSAGDCSAPEGGSCADQNTFNIGSFDVSEPAAENGTGVGDNFVHLINPTADNGTLCAMMFVYDDDQELGECCGCPVSPDKLLTLSVKNQLTNNWALNFPDTDSGVLAIYSALPNNPNTPTNPDACEASEGCNGGCDPTQVFNGTPALVGSILKEQRIADQGVTSLTETNMFQEGVPDENEINIAFLFCLVQVTNSSGHGVCNCGPEDESLR
jgi:hypothetical protein